MNTGAEFASTALALPGTTFARVNWSRWIADCSNPHCRDAMMLPPGTPGMRCKDCGAISEVVWPPDVEAITVVLARRPAEWNRNWAPPETVADLILENLEHGILPANLEELPLGQLLELGGRRAIAGPEVAS